LRRADRVVTVSQALKNVAVGLDIGEEKISVIPNGIDTGKFSPIPEGQARKILNLPDKKVILSVGALIPTKGFDLLIQAVKILIDKHGRKDLYLVIVGEGPARGNLEKLIAALDLGENVHLAGGVPHKNIHLWYNAADLFCLASHREGWACVLIESLACGTPVVATNVGGAQELVCSDKYGLLAKIDIEDIAAKISVALDKDWNKDEIVEYARGFTWEIAAKELYDLYGKVLIKS
jgi:glycosyltransferase involved in cell wall biosynthesis